LSKPREKNLREIRADPNLRFPSLLEVFEIKDPTRFCEFHNSKGHDTRDCIALKDELERLARDKNMWAFIQRFVTNYVWKSDTGRAKPYDNRRPQNLEGVTSNFLIEFTFLHRNPSIIHYSTKAILQLTQGNGYNPKTIKIIVQRKS
jgi:hypothetical protein